MQSGLQEREGRVFRADVDRADEAISVLVIDDHPSFRAAARALIEATPGFVPLAEAGTGEEGIEIAIRLCPDLVIIDVDLPGIDGVETCLRLAAADVKARVVFTSADENAMTVDGSGPCSGPFVPKRELSSPVLLALWRDGRG